MTSPPIMLVEDSVFNARLIQALLTRQGLEVTVAGSAEAALTILEESTPALILMDVLLPGMSGLELTRILKNDGSKRSVSVIALTANDSMEERQAASEAGCDGFISKPIDPVRFASQVRSLLDTAASTRFLNVSESEFRRIKKDFLIEGVQESGVLLQWFENGNGDPAAIGRIVHRWVGCGETAGLPEITVRSRRLRDLMANPAENSAATTDEAKALGRLFAAALSDISDEPTPHGEQKPSDADRIVS